MAKDEAYRKAEKKIAEAQRSNADALDLSGMRLTELPESLGGLANLQRLYLMGNQLTELPESLGGLAQLQMLDLENNQLTELPEWLGGLAQLQELYLSGNQLTELPESLGGLTQLQALNLFNNQLTELPESLGGLAKLQRLYLSGNQLTELPESLGGLTQLQALFLDSNQLTELPESLGGLAQLQTLDLWDNQLTELPESLGGLAKLQTLFLHGNPGLGLPPEILGATWEDVITKNAKLASPQSILDYYFRARGEPLLRLNEAKMLIVGQGGVGKTSLLDYMVDNKKCDEKKEPTEGINIADWPVKGKKGAGGKFEEVNVHIWDFGGQEIMHATHQFFLTRRSLYLLVIDARAGEKESNIHYWLKIIGSYGGDSPVLVVINKCDQHPHDLNETALLRDYPNICGFVQTSCETGEGIAELKREIGKQIRRLPNVFDELPLSYFQVKEELAKKAKERNYIQIEEYHRICKSRKVNKKEDQEQLIRFLHDLGVVLNFQDPDDPYSLNDPFVLNPEWVTQGVYAIVNDKPLKAQKDGVLRRTKLAEVLNKREGYPEDRHDFIVRKMIQFELAYELDRAKGEQRWLIPELLDPKEPENLDWRPDESLNFQYAYPVLPAGVICRFIVRMQHRVQRKDSWRSGTVLEIDGNRVLVRGDMERDKVFIAVQGEVKPRRERLAVVREAFRYIHSTIPELKPKEEIPLPDNPGIALAYDHLLTLEELGEQTCVPEGARKRYVVRDLLNGVDSALYRLRRRRDKIKEREAMSEKHVFISYCHDNKDKVARLVEELEDAGESVWWDEDILGGRDWKEAVRMAMKNAYAVVVCLSPELTEQRYRSGVYPEIRDAIETFRQYEPGHAFIFPVKLGKCEIPPIEIDDTRTLDRLQCIDLYPENKRAAGVQKLLASLGGAPGR